MTWGSSVLKSLHFSGVNKPFLSFMISTNNVADVLMEEKLGVLSV